MTKIKDLQTALTIFEESAIKHMEASKEGDYKTVNINYDKIIKVIAYLKEHNKIDELLQFLYHEHIGVRLAAATYLLPHYEEKGIEVLETISNSNDFLSFTAEITLSEWRNGNLKL